MTIIALLAWLLLAAIVVYVVYLVIDMLTLPPQVALIAKLLISLIVLFLILQQFVPGFGAGHLLR